MFLMKVCVDRVCVCVQARDLQKMLKLEEEMDRRPATVV